MLETTLVSQDIFQRFNHLVCTAEAARQWASAPGPLTLRRLWPQSRDQIGLEYVDAQGKIVPGQWLGDPDKFTQLYKATKRISNRSPWVYAERQIILQPNGIDRRLIGLAKLLEEPAAQLLVHRPERRAVVRLQGTSAAGYAKVVRPERAAALAALMRQVQSLATGHFQTPTVERVDEAQGILYLATLPGQSLYDRLASDNLAQLATYAGQALRQLHQIAAPADAQPHSAASETQVLDKWLQQLGWLAPAAVDALKPYHAQVATGLQAGNSPTVLLHRDFYDKQIFVTAAGELGLLDFDLLAVGEAALDVANALVHFELRALQGHYDLATAGQAVDAFLAAYQPAAAVERRVQAYADATRLRLACVYGCRPYGINYVPALVARIGLPVGAANRHRQTA